MSQRGKHTVVSFDNNSGTPVAITTEVVEGANIPLNYDELEASGYAQDKNYIKGQGDTEVTLKMKFNSTTHPLFTHQTTGAVHSDTARTLTIQYGNNVAPTTGDPQISGEFICVSAAIENAKDGIRYLTAKLRVPVGQALPAYSTI